MNDIKVKLVAIAKDEAAYLPEWIFHHLYFGFDEIEVYVNFTSDGSYQVLEKIQKNYPVKYRNAEYLLDASYKNVFDAILLEKYIQRNLFQARAYAELFFSAKQEGFSHILFLDIDEYWTPVCFSKSIKDIIHEFDNPDIVSFIWKNKVGESEEFGRPFKSEVLYVEAAALKTMVKTTADITLVNSHKSRYASDKAKRDKLIGAKKMDKAFILHRYQRSELEYLSLLGRGDPKLLGKFGLKFNRGGYTSTAESLKLSFEQTLINQYDMAYQNFLKTNALFDDLAQAKQFISERANLVLDYIKDSIKTYQLAKKVVTGLTIEQTIYAELNSARGLHKEEVDILKNIAFDLEKKDLNKAYQLFKIVYAFKPNATVIEKKLKRFAKLLGKESDFNPSE